MTLSESDRALLEVARQVSNEQRELAKQIQRASLLEYERRERADAVDRQRIFERLLAMTGVDTADLTEIQARQRREIDASEAFREEQRRAIADYLQNSKAGVVRTALPPAPSAALAGTVELDTAISVGPPQDDTTSTSDEFQRRLVIPQPPAPQRNVAKADLRMDHHTPVPKKFEIPVPNESYIDYFFAWTAEADVRLNALSFLKPNGVYFALSSWSPCVESVASVSFIAGLDVSVFDTSGTLVLVSNGTRDDRLEERVSTGPFGSNQGGSGYFSDTCQVADNGLLSVGAGSRVFVNVWAYLNATTDVQGSASAELDFLHEDGFEINVPNVFLFTFPPTG